MAYALQTFALGDASFVRSDGARFSAIVSEHGAFVWRTVRRFGVPAADADDAAQEAFVILSNKLGEVRRGAEKGFLFHAAVNVSLHWRRTYARRRENIEHDFAEAHVDGSPSPEEIAEMRQKIELLDRCLATLSVDLRTVLVLCDIEQVTMAEASETLDVPAGTIASRLRRAREAFDEAAQSIVGKQP